MFNSMHLLASALFLTEHIMVMIGVGINIYVLGPVQTHMVLTSIV